MLLKRIATQSLRAGIAWLALGFVTGDVLAALPLAFGGIIGFAVLNALADIVDYLSDISAKISKSFGAQVSRNCRC